jgi:preprotein translocase subunit SecA
MLSQYSREKIENWVSDFVASDRLREVPASTHEHAAVALVEFMTAACSPRERTAADAGRDHGIEPDEVEEADLKHALLQHVARLNLPAQSKAGMPALCAAFLVQLEDEGRLGGGRVLGAYMRALREAFDEAASGKRKPITRPGSKIGRNDPCPCGSGKKYKQCCMRG